MHNTRPKNLNLFTIQFPLPAIISILHRLSGVFLFLLIPIALWLLAFSLTESGFDALQEWMDNFYTKIILWVLLAPFCFHLIAGCRHLLMDIHLGTSLKGGKLSSLLTLIIFFVFVILVGIWLW
ncbi:MAG: succinate dehydrogenase, cytochrome b556 subunit [Gammaproteobacteria bacterium]|nr:MAG: succinate dehydrogenase, cytochrome b556 subunit [Gammaproteobacteria bacterium]